MSDKLRNEARLLRGIGVFLSPSLIIVIVNWLKNDPSGFSKLSAMIWWLPAALSLIFLALSFGRFLAADSEEMKENQKLIEENNISKVLNTSTTPQSGYLRLDTPSRVHL